jgi:hypothetical protein
MNNGRYPRTPHFPWSPGGTVDDKVLSTDEHFYEREVVQTTKFDGENTTMTNKKIYARSPDSSMRHESRSYVSRIWAAIRHDIPDGWRIVGENMYATHSIHYDYLPSYFLMFAVINENGIFLPWEETMEWAELLNLETVYELWDGIYDQGVIKMGQLHNTQYTADLGEGEGYVVRVKAAFHESMAHWRMAKYVRAQHVTTSKHWMHGRITVNQLRVDVE